MVWANSQHKCSSIRPTCAFPSSACASMSDLEDAVATAAAAAEEPASQPASEESDSGGEPTATDALTPADGQAASDAKATALPPTVGKPGSSADHIAGNAARVEEKGKNLLSEIQALKNEQKRAREAKKQITKDLRNAEKRRQRLKKRAKQLSDSDLLAVMTLRSAEQALRRTGGEPTAPLVPLTDGSEAGSATPTSRTGGRDPSESPIQPKRKARTS